MPNSLDLYRRLVSDLSKNKVERVYLFHGTEEFLKSDLAARVRHAVLQGKGGTWNQDRFDARNTGPGEVWTSLRTVPMFGRMRLVELDQVETWPKEHQEALADKLGQIPETSCLLLLAGKLDARRRLVKEAAKVGVAGRFEPPRTREAAALLESWAKERGLNLDPGASARFLELAGSDLGVLQMALENAALYAGSDRITAEHVTAAVPDTRQAVIFELTDAVAEKDLDGALDALGRLGKDAKAHLKVLAMLARQIRLLISARQAMAERVPQSRWADVLDVHPFVAQKLAHQARVHTMRDLARAHRLVAETDLALKSSKQDPNLLLQRIVIEMCR